MSNLLMRARLHTTSYAKKMNNQTHFGPVVREEINAFLRALPPGVDMNLSEKWSEAVGLFRPTQNMLFEGLYYVHLMNWLCNFPAENILIIRSEVFFQHPSKILDSVVQFLGLKRLDANVYDNITSVSYNSRQAYVPDYQKLANPDREILLDVFRPFNQALMELLQWNNSLWQ